MGGGRGMSYRKGGEKWGGLVNSWEGGQRFCAKILGVRDFAQKF
jgi:hypothetical protein